MERWEEAPQDMPFFFSFKKCLKTPTNMGRKTSATSDHKMRVAQNTSADHSDM